MPEPDGGPTPWEVTIHGGDASMVAVFDETGVWRPIVKGPDGTAKVSVIGRVTLATACELPLDGFFNYFVSYAGPGDTDLDTYCKWSPAAAEDFTTVWVQSGAAQVSIGPFTLSDGELKGITSGTYDVIASDDTVTPNRFEIRRDTSIDSDDVVEVRFDLAETGVAMQRAELSTSNADGDEIYLSSRFTSAGGTSHRRTPGDTEAWLVPSSQRIAGDRASISAVAARPGAISYRAVVQPVTGDEAAVALALPAEHLAAVTVTWSGAPRATWQIDGAWEPGYLSFFSVDYTAAWDAIVWPSWIAAGGSASEITMPDPTTIPGWQSKWNIADPTGMDWRLSVARVVGDATQLAYQTAFFGERPAQRAPRAPMAARAGAPARPLPALMQRKLARGGAD